MLVSDTSNEKAKQELATTLRERKTILMAGAGSSKPVGYPLWEELAEEMRTQLFTPPFIKAKDLSPMLLIGRLKEKLDTENRLADYHNFLQTRFEPQAGSRNHDRFHPVLVQLPFCGIVTTNYDRVLESAIEEAYTNDNGPWHCDSIDLCHESLLPAFRFLRTLSSTGHSRDAVLHLHGYYTNPKLIILTETDYLTKYGQQRKDAQGELLAEPLDTLHRKVIWSLLCMHSFVFMGFSLKDEFFMHLLRIVQRDFELGSREVHFAIMSYTDEEDRDRTFTQLKVRGVSPVFFHAPATRMGIDYSDLGNFIFELAEIVGVPTSTGKLRSITQRMLRR